MLNIEKFCDQFTRNHLVEENDVTANRHLPYEVRNEVRCVTRNFIQSAKRVCAKRSNQNFHRHLKLLAEDEEITVVKFDKGNGVCLMQKETYLEKLDSIINDRSKFTKVEKSTRKNARHPLLKRQEYITRSIKEHVVKYVPEEVSKRLMPSGTSMGKLYGTCKVHKENYPLRPIVSMINTPEYNLARYLDGIIKPLIPSKYSISSNVEFLEQLRNVEYEDGDFCISYDVVSLFTNVPLDLTISIVADELYADDNINKPPMPKKSFVLLLRDATGGMFQHRQEVYQHCDGVSMGNPLAPTLANFFLGFLERNLFTTTPGSTKDILKSEPKLYLRYVDDVFCVFKSSANYKQFLSKLNNLHPNLKFTFEFGGSTLPFLDTRITLKSPTFESTIYRKKTNTNVVINYSATAPTQWKRALAKWFLNRAVKICSNNEHFQKEIIELRKIYHMNGYPKSFFDKIFNNHCRNKNQPEGSDVKPGHEETVKTTHATDETSAVQTPEVPENKAFVKIPYVGRPSILFGNRLKKIFTSLKNVDVRVVYTTTKVKDHFRLKDQTPKELLARVVYGFTCPRDSEIRYIGYTNRNLIERVREHLRGGTAVSDHISECDDCRSKGVTAGNFIILKQCRKRFDTSIYEALLIKRHNPVLNRQLVKPGKTYKLKIFY